MAHAAGIPSRWARRCPPPKKIASSPERPGPHRISLTWFPRPIQIHIPNGLSIGSSVLAQRMVVANREMHRPGHICGNRQHLCTGCMHAMRSKSRRLPTTIMHRFLGQGFTQGKITTAQNSSLPPFSPFLFLHSFPFPPRLRSRSPPLFDLLCPYLPPPFLPSPTLEVGPLKSS